MENETAETHVEINFGNVMKNKINIPKLWMQLSARAQRLKYE